jgi:uncharacterized protein
MRLLVLILLVVLAVWLIRRALAHMAHKDTPPGQKAVEGDLVACAHCALNLPRGEACEAGGLFYCSEQHARLGPKV